MSILRKLIRLRTAEEEYFSRRKTEEAEGQLPSHLPVARRPLDKELFVELLRLLKRHDVRSTVAILANTVDGVNEETGIMINKSILPQKLIVYLQETRLSNIEEAIKLFKANKPNFEGCYYFESAVAAKLNIPAGVAVYPVFSSRNSNLVMMLIFKKSIDRKKELLKSIRKKIHESG